MPRATPSWARGSGSPGTGFKVTPESFNRIVRFMEQNEESVVKAREGMDLLVQLMAVFTRSEAMKKSQGPVAARRRSNPAMAYRIPVQRITGRYYASWYVRRAGSGRWRVGNDSFEAVLIENGIFQRVRRPILKMSVLSMLRYVQQTQVATKYMQSVINVRKSATNMGSGWAVFTKTEEGPRFSFTRNMSAGPQGPLP